MTQILKKLACFTLCILYLCTAMAEPGDIAVETERDRHIGVAQPLIDFNTLPEAKIGSLEFRPCTLPFQGRERTVQCARHRVAENPADVNGKTIDLFVVRLPAKKQSGKAQDPVLFIAGGPGQAASETFLFADHMWRSLAKNRDFYLIDQRGTGHSGFLDCGDRLKSHQTAAQQYNPEQVKQKTRECLEHLSGDPRFYTTDLSVQDFDQVRKALAINEWNLLGVSYGTRVITHYMRRFPHSVRTAVLDSMIPPQHVVGEQIAIRSQESLNALLQRCANEPACHAQFPDLQNKVDALFAQLEAKPVTIPVENLSTGGVEKRSFTRQELAMLVRLNLYRPDTTAILPPMLHQAVTQQYFSPLIRSARLVARKLEGAMSYGLHHSVMCTEEYPFYALTEAEIQANKASYLGTSVIDFIADVCSVWPKGEVPDEMKAPLKSAIPTLLLSGEYDPITPPDYADQALQSLTQGRHLVLKGQGHFVSSVGCTPRIIEQFIDSQSVNNLDVSCLERLSEAPIFLNYNGTAP